MKFSKIMGTGSYLPEKVVTNTDLEKILDTSDEWIRDRTGICERRVARDDETSGDMAEVAALRAMQAAGVDPDRVTYNAVMDAHAKVGHHRRAEVGADVEEVVLHESEPAVAGGCEAR